MLYWGQTPNKDNDHDPKTSCPPPVLAQFCVGYRPTQPVYDSAATLADLEYLGRSGYLAAVPLRFVLPASHVLAPLLFYPRQNAHVEQWRSCGFHAPCHSLGDLLQASVTVAPPAAIERSAASRIRTTASPSSTQERGFSLSLTIPTNT